MPNFNEAMVTLQTMFPEMDFDVIKMMLIQTHGHMERTVEYLLQLSSSSSASTDSSSTFNNNTNNTHNSHNSNIITPQILLDVSQPMPNDFLRPPSFFRSLKKDEATKQQTERDFMLASVLQDEYFLRQIQRHPEVLRRRDPYPNSSSTPVPPIRSLSSPGMERMEQKPSTDQETSFFEKLSQLGTEAKIKLSRLFSISNEQKEYMNLPNDESNSSLPNPGRFTINDDDETYDDINSIEMSSISSIPDNKMKEISRYSLGDQDL